MKNGDSFLITPRRIEQIYSIFSSDERMVIDVFERGSVSDRFEFIERQFANQKSYTTLSKIETADYSKFKFFPESIDEEIVELVLDEEQIEEFETVKEEHRIETDNSNRSSTGFYTIFILGFVMWLAI
jgi:hypothetical protein